ncbi:tetracycline resistance MFS efflux pump [Platysternon megacephalum]|uniref:Tetracycline resistance MFS efflux pump n=1 Tax=Platysternon megacephalum TaxID=55544 RepID=A0A4D9DP10_9SAUR|nr:tetracycline resistance MFS efflux pump [Platysternon megacephalum]
MCTALYVVPRAVQAQRGRGGTRRGGCSCSPPLPLSPGSWQSRYPPHRGPCHSSRACRRNAQDPEATPWTQGAFSWLLSCSRAIQTTAVCHKNRAARVRVGKGDKPVTYEQAHPPHYIAHRKGWLSLHTGNLDGEAGAAERTVEDVFIRKFIFGTFHGCLATEVVLKRRANVLVVCAVFLQCLPPYKFYFLVGYTETVLSFLYKCPVRLEVQTVPKKVIYKYL